VTAEQLQNLEFLIRNGGTYDLAPNAGSDVLEGIDAFLARFIAYPTEHARHAHVLWIAHTWLMDCWGTTPRLLFISPEAGSGKTAALEITEQLTPRADLTGNTTPAYFYYKIEESLELNGCRPTLLYDEIDTVFGPKRVRSTKSEEMRSIIDNGYRRSGTVARRIGKINQRFKVYAAMAMAGAMLAGDVPDTIRTRSIVIPMQWAAPGEITDYWDSLLSPPLCTPYREVLQYWIEFVHGYALEHPAVDIPKGIRNRDRDCWQPLLRVADLAGGRWPDVAAVAAVAAVSASGVNSEPSEGLWLLWECKAIFDRRQKLTGSDRVFTTELLDELRATGRFRWTAKPVQEAAIRLAQIVGGYGVLPPTPASRDQRIGGDKAKGYRAEWFEDAWRRYPKPETAETAETNGQPDE
jgi:Protein of unknown function (DUF3631)